MRVPLHRAWSVTLREAALHYVDSTEHDVDDPRAAFLAHLVDEYVQQHREDFSKKPDRDDSPPHWVYPAGGDRGYSPDESDGEADEGDDGDADDGKMRLSLSTSPVEEDE